MVMIQLIFYWSSLVASRYCFHFKIWQSEHSLSWPIIYSHYERKKAEICIVTWLDHQSPLASLVIKWLSSYANFLDFEYCANLNSRNNGDISGTLFPELLMNISLVFSEWFNAEEDKLVKKKRPSYVMQHLPYFIKVAQPKLVFFNSSRSFRCRPTLV